MHICPWAGGTNTHNNGIDHDAKADIVDNPLGHLSPPVGLGPRALENGPHLLHPLLVVLPDQALFVLAGGGVGEHVVGVLGQQVQDGGLQGLCFLGPQLLAVLPARLFAPEHGGGDLREGLVVGLGAYPVRADGVGDRRLVVLAVEEGLREVVVRLHGVGRDGEARLAVGDDGLPEGQFEARHGAVGVEGGVFGVCYDAGFALAVRAMDVRL